MIRTMAQGLAEAGVDVQVAATDDDGPGHMDVPLEQPMVDNGVTFWHFRRQTRFYTASWPLTHWLARHIPDFDLVHMHALFSYAALPAALFAARGGVPYVVRPLGTLNRWGMQQHRPWLKQLSFRLIESRILKGAAAVHYTSEQERLEATKLGVNGHALVIPLGVDFDLLQSQPSNGWLTTHAPHLADRTIFLFLSRLDPKKGLDLLLPAFAQLRDQCPETALVIAGDGETEFVTSLHQEAARLGIQNDVVWAGFLTGKEKRAALATADAFILPSYSENFGIAAVEALACGLPAILSDNVAIHREIAAAHAGLVVKCQIEALANAMHKLATNAELRRTLGVNGKQLAQSRFSKESMINALVNAYAEIVSANSVPSVLQ